MSDRSCIQLAAEIERRNIHPISPRYIIALSISIDLLRRGRDRYRSLKVYLNLSVSHLIVDKQFCIKRRDTSLAKVI